MCMTALRTWGGCQGNKERVNSLEDLFPIQGEAVEYEIVFPAAAHSDTTLTAYL